MATSAGPAGLTAAAAEKREGAAAAGSSSAAPPAGPATFLSLPAPFSEEGTRSGAGGAAATGPRPEPRGKRSLGGGRARRGVKGGRSVVVLSPGGLRGPAAGGSPRSAPEPASGQGRKHPSVPPAPGSLLCGHSSSPGRAEQKFSV